MCSWRVHCMPVNSSSKQTAWINDVYSSWKSIINCPWDMELMTPTHYCPQRLMQIHTTASRACKCPNPATYLWGGWFQVLLEVLQAGKMTALWEVKVLIRTLFVKQMQHHLCQIHGETIMESVFTAFLCNFVVICWLRLRMRLHNTIHGNTRTFMLADSNVAGWNSGCVVNI